MEHRTESLHIKIKAEVTQWKRNNYASHTDEIAQILNFQFINEERTTLRYLRKPQFEAIETYLYLRFVKNTPHIIDIYKAYYPQPADVLRALNMRNPDISDIVMNEGIDGLFEKIKTDSAFVKKYRLENLRESLSLSYPSYILSLVMGAGKTILIGAIVFIEFALSLKTQKNEFLKNALIFAPGKTILGSLKEISFIDVALILPPHMAKIVESNIKTTYTHDKQKNIPVINSSNYNIIVTNIEKIRIQSRKKTALFNSNIKNDERENIVNQRLQTLSSLDNLGIFSDEAHNTYGQDLDKGIKKVRQTIDYLADKTNLKIVINTTGTPYFRKQILKDVVFWYGLLEGIEENILKDIRGNNIYSYAQVEGEKFIAEVLDDFFKTYANIKIEGGHKSKIALYFPRIEDVRNVKPFIEKKVTTYGLGLNAVFEVNSQSSNKDKDIFINRINDKHLPYRVFLLVGMGKEGWNCPSLFSCCLARDLGNSNNFVLQAATRCLRQVTGNTHHARIYLSEKNTQILDRQLQENYGETLTNIKNQHNKFVEQKITLIKYDDKLPQLQIKKKVKKYIKKNETITNIVIKKPQIQQETAKLITYDFSELTKNTTAHLTEKEITDLKNENEQLLSVFEAAQKIAALYSIDYFVVFSQLQKHFPGCEISVREFFDIKQQIEEQINNYTVKEIEVHELLTIIKKEGFQEEIDDRGVKVYTTTILVNTEKLEALLKKKAGYRNIDDLSFHYDPYRFDSGLEVAVFEYTLAMIQEKRENIKDFLFTGGITDKNKTDLVFEYRDKEGMLRNYTPDFLIIKKNGEFIFIESKGKHLAENFKIKEEYFLSYLTENCTYKLLVSENENILMDDKQWIQKQIDK